ncbi:hypothetical protein ACU19_09365 [Actinobaculum suis]|uniref:hypothetical protein n=1 Tax=Actinobaculum suis TaxID=1657 RepID=UPI00066FD3A4|nr:hypothetical protein [Actinobaculum suis]KMY22564.1 hypothetical protein ACU19_09365 [Actinobaculum suis]
MELATRNLTKNDLLDTDYWMENFLPRLTPVVIGKGRAARLEFINTLIHGGECDLDYLREITAPYTKLFPDVDPAALIYIEDLGGAEEQLLSKLFGKKVRLYSDRVHCDVITEVTEEMDAENRETVFRHEMQVDPHKVITQPYTAAYQVLTLADGIKGVVLEVFTDNLPHPHLEIPEYLKGGYNYLNENFYRCVDAYRESEEIGDQVAEELQSEAYERAFSFDELAWYGASGWGLKDPEGWEYEVGTTSDTGARSLGRNTNWQDYEEPIRE